MPPPILNPQTLQVYRLFDKETPEIHEIESALDQGLPANAYDPNGCSMLEWAMLRNQPDIAKVLILKGANPNTAFISDQLREGHKYYSTVAAVSVILVMNEVNFGFLLLLMMYGAYTIKR